MKKQFFAYCLLLYIHLHAQPLEKGNQIPPLVFTELFNYSASQLSMNELKGRLVIFDFWGINCVSCVQSFPKLDSLQKQFSNKIQIILVSKEPKEKIAAFFQKRRQIKIPGLPFICNDTILNKLFPHQGTPAYAWLDQQHRYRFITEGFNVNDQSIAKLINGEEFSLATHQSGHYKIPAIVNTQHQPLMQFSSFLSNCLSGYQQPYPEHVRSRSASIQEKCASVTELYITAYNENGKYNFKRPGRLVTDFEEPKKYIRQPQGPGYDLWRSKYAYNYELFIPLSDTLLKFIYMKQDLQRFFQLSANVMPVYKTCIVLETLTDMVMFKTKGGTPAHTFFRSSVSRDVSEPVRGLKNKPFSFLVHGLSTWLEAEYNIPFENTVKCNSNIDIELSADAVESLDINKLNSELNKYGLVLIKKEIAITCLILSDKEKPVK